MENTNNNNKSMQRHELQINLVCRSFFFSKNHISIVIFMLKQWKKHFSSQTDIANQLERYYWKVYARSDEFLCSLILSS